MVDNAIRGQICCGANPEKIAILDNFCMGDPNDKYGLGDLVELARGLGTSVEGYTVPIISGKDSFNNFFIDSDGFKRTIPCTLLVSAIGVVEDLSHVIGASIRFSKGAKIFLIGGLKYDAVNFYQNTRNYACFYKALCAVYILSTHDVSDGGLLVSIAEMGFSLLMGLELDFGVSDLFFDSNGCIVVQVKGDYIDSFLKMFDIGQVFELGDCSAKHKKLFMIRSGEMDKEIEISKLKKLWKKGLERC